MIKNLMKKKELEPEKTVKRYNIVTGKLGSVVGAVQLLLDDGWELHGGAFPIVISKMNESGYAQAMVKRG